MKKPLWIAGMILTIGVTNLHAQASVMSLPVTLNIGSGSSGLSDMPLIIFFIVWLGLTIFTVIVLKWIGAWMLGVTNVLQKQDRTDKVLNEILAELKKQNRSNDKEV